MNEPRKIALTLAIVMLFGLICLAVEWTIDVFGRRWLLLIGACLAALLLLLGIHFAHAHDHERPELTPWFKQLKSGKGMCCDGSDALHLRDVDWEVKGEHYRVRIPKNGADMAKAAMGEQVESDWVDVPKDAVIDEPNRDGSTLVWPLYGYMGASVRCFMPGSMT